MNGEFESSGELGNEAGIDLVGLGELDLGSNKGKTFMSGNVQTGSFSAYYEKGKQLGDEVELRGFEPRWSCAIKGGGCLGTWLTGAGAFVKNAAVGIDYLAEVSSSSMEEQR